MRKQQPLILRYQGFDASGNVASEPVDIYCHYESGLEAGDVVFNDRVNITFTVPEGVFHKSGQDAKALGYITTVANMANIMQRSADGVWAPLATGLNGVVYAMAIHPITGDLYIGGGFSNAGDGNGDNIVKWNGTAFVPLSTGLNSTVFALAFAANGDLYIGGTFTDAGDANGDFITKWNGSAFVSLSTGLNEAVFALAFAPNGDLYIGGDFTNITDPNGDYITKWNGSAFSSLSTGLNGRVRALAFAPNGDLYIGGEFTNFTDPNGDYITKWNGTAFSSLNTGLSAQVNALAFAPNGDLFIAGYFQNAGDSNGDRITRWNGTSFNSISTGLNDGAHSLYFAPDGDLYIGGIFTIAGGATLPDRMCVLKNNTFLPLDINVQYTSAYFYSIVKNKNTGTIYVGGEWTGTDALSATVTVPNVLGSDTYPILYLTGPGLIYQVKNYTTGQAIYFDNFTLLAGENVKIDLRPGKKTFISSYRGNIGRYVLDGSDIDFKLIPGNNNVSVLITGGTAATSASMVWQANYNSIDEANYDS